MDKLEIQDWDRDRLWENIEWSLKKKKKRRRMLWWFWFGVSGTSLFCLFLYFYFTQIRLIQTDPTTDRVLNSTAPSLIYLEEVDCPPEETNIYSSRQTGVPEKSEQENSFLEISPVQSTVMTKKFPELNNWKTRPYSEISKIQFPTLPPLQSRINTDILRPQATIYHDTYVDNGYRQINNWNLPFLNGMEILPLQFKSELSFLRTLDSTKPKRSKYLALRFATSYSRGSIRHFGSPEWISIKENSESFDWATTNNFTLDWHYHKHWHAYLGLDYQQLVSQYNFSTTNEFNTEIVSDSAVVFSIAGQDYFQKGVLQKTVITERHIAHNNFLHRWFLDFGIGYSQSFGRYRLNARVGPRLLFAQSFDGIALAEENLQHILDNRISSRSYYRTNVNIGLKGAIALDYHLSPKTALFLGVQFEQDDLLRLRSVPYRTRYQLWGIQLGWKYRLSLLTLPRSGT